MHVGLWLQKVVVERGICLDSVCNLEFCIQGGHNRVYIAVVIFSHGRLVLLAKCGSGLLSVHKGLVGMFCRGC